MRFLVDNQLPPALARFITQELGAEAVHVTALNLASASDAELWDYASKNEYVIISKDEDFLNLLSKAPTAKLIWVRIGNCRRSFLLDAFRRLWPKIDDRFVQGDRLVELR